MRISDWSSDVCSSDLEPLLLGALGGGLLGGGDTGLEPRQRRMVLVGLLDQRVQALGFVEVAAVAALLGGDHRHRQQVGQRARYAGVAGQLVAQRERLEERRVGKEWAGTGKSRWSPFL